MAVDAQRQVIRQHTAVRLTCSWTFLEQADVLVSNTSSTCLEALAKGVPVAVIAAANVPAQNLIPRSVPEGFWRLCCSPADLVHAITEPADPQSESNADSERMGERIRADYFAPVTREGVAKLLHAPLFTRPVAADTSVERSIDLRGELER